MKRNIALILMALSSSLGYSDRGMIPINMNVNIFEPNQRAMIAWNGTEEILLLTTDLSASDTTTVLEVLPLLSEPKVARGSLEVFQRAINLINRKIGPKFLAKGEGIREEVVPAAEVTFHKKIGAHDISVTHLLSKKGFIKWVGDYLKSIGVQKEIISDEMKSLIEEYIEANFVWYVFDVLSLGKETVTNEPIQYRFKTTSLFYPLRITSTASGNTSIELLILTPHLLQRFPGLPIERVRLRHEPITITNDELKDLSKDMYEILSGCEKLKLRIWKIEGELKSFDKDLIVR